MGSTIIQKDERLGQAKGSANLSRRKVEVSSHFFLYADQLLIYRVEDSHLHPNLDVVSHSLGVYEYQMLCQLLLTCLEYFIVLM